MPEYLAPGVYVEEVSFRAKSIEGVSTTTTAFIGPTRTGPVDIEPDVLTSLADFEAVYGDGQPLVFHTNATAGGADAPTPMTNFLWHAVRAFFEEGGKRLYVVRTYLGPADGTDGCPRRTVTGATADPTQTLTVRARFPGVSGAVQVRFTVRLGPNLLGGTPAAPTVGAINHTDVVRIKHVGSPLGPATLYVADLSPDPTTGKPRLSFVDRSGNTVLPSALRPDIRPDLSDAVRQVFLTVTVFPADPDRLASVWADIPFDPRHTSFGAPDSLAKVFGVPPLDKSLERTLPIVVTLGDGVKTGIDLLRLLDAFSATTGGALLDRLGVDGSTDPERSVNLALSDGGSDGRRPGVAEYEGKASDDSPVRTGLKAFEAIDDISIVAAPGSTFRYENEYHDTSAAIQGLVIAHCENMRYRVAVLDSGDKQTVAQVRAMRGRVDSKYAAMYYPWVRILDPITRVQLDLPPSGFVTGIYARNDVNRAVWKAPANEVINLALDFETTINKAQQDVLNPEGINCLRFFEGRGFRVWGARTISSDPEWKYVNVRRWFVYLEHSIDRGTQWAVFEPNNPELWTNIRLTASDFLYNEWAAGALLGDKPEQAYFVKCDRSTMTQNDLDNGRLVCLIGVAVVRPAEFVIFRIGQWTADRKV